jgi:hypothetical protein
MGSVVVLDLDETLLYACSKQECKCQDDPLLWQAVCNVAANRCRKVNLEFLQLDSYFVFLRPHVRAFLRYCRANFRVLVIFTAGNSSHAEGIHERLFQKAAGLSADFLLHRESCGKVSTTTKGALTLVPFQKNLCHLREHIAQHATPQMLAQIDWHDCLFIDDLAMHVANNCGETLLVPRFDYPCLASLMVPLETASVDDRAVDEAAHDDTLLRLMRFIKQKTSMHRSTKWQQVDKRFALFS